MSKAKVGGKRKKIIIVTIIILILLSGLFSVLNTMTRKENPVEVSAGTVEKMDLDQTVSVVGIISGSQSAEVVSALNYEIVSILVEEGDLVKKDQVIAELDDKDLKYEYQKAKKSLEETKIQYDSNQILYKEGAISRSEYLSSKNAYENSLINLESLNIAEKTKIRSPINGTVTRVNVSLGRYANDTEDKKPMFIIEDLERLKMDVKISEYDIGKISLDQEVVIRADVLGKQSVKGRVSHISPTGEMKEAMSKEMVVPVQIDIEASNLIGGVTARAKIIIESKRDVMTVPIDAISEDQDTGESYVFLIDGVTAKKMVVQPGIEGDFYIEILDSPLVEGDMVILSPTFNILDGSEVSVISL